MKIPTPTPQEDTRCPDSAWFANQWLRGSPRRAIRTAPVIAVVQELLNILRDEQASTQRAHTSLRRAVRLLGVIAAEAGTQPTRQTTDRYDSDIHVPTLEQIAGSASSRRFAAEWLRGSPHATIRTKPVIAVVDELLYALLDEFAPAAEVETTFCRAVRTLSVFVTDNEHERPRLNR